MKTLSKRTRNRLLWLASLFDGWAAALRGQVRARTPKRKAKGASGTVRDDRTIDAFPSEPPT